MEAKYPKLHLFGKKLHHKTIEDLHYKLVNIMPQPQSPTTGGYIDSAINTKDAN